MLSNVENEYLVSERCVIAPRAGNKCKLWQVVTVLWRKIRQSKTLESQEWRGFYTEKATGYIEKRHKSSESMKHIDFGGQNFPIQGESNSKALRQEVVFEVFEKQQENHCSSSGMNSEGDW